MPAGTEWVEVVDDADRVVDTVPRARMRAERLQHRAVFVVVIDRAGRLLVHRRSDTKDVWPRRWDIAVGGVVAAGEDYPEAATREVAEELGVAGVAPEEIARGRYVDDDVALLARCYRLRHDGPFRFADGEVVEARWVDRGELASMIATLPFVPDSLALLLPLV